MLTENFLGPWNIDFVWFMLYDLCLMLWAWSGMNLTWLSWWKLDNGIETPWSNPSKDETWNLLSFNCWIGLWMMWGWVIEYIGIKINEKSVCLCWGRVTETWVIIWTRTSDENNVWIIDNCRLSGNKILEMKRKIVWARIGENWNLKDHYAKKKIENFKD